jgi:hypothetical protein
MIIIKPYNQISFDAIRESLIQEGFEKDETTKDSVIYAKNTTEYVEIKTNFPKLKVAQEEKEN